MGLIIILALSCLGVFDPYQVTEAIEFGPVNLGGYGLSLAGNTNVSDDWNPESLGLTGDWLIPIPNLGEELTSDEQINLQYLEDWNEKIYDAGNETLKQQAYYEFWDQKCLPFSATSKLGAIFYEYCQEWYLSPHNYYSFDVERCIPYYEPVDDTGCPNIDWWIGNKTYKNWNYGPSCGKRANHIGRCKEESQEYKERVIVGRICSDDHVTIYTDGEYFGRVKLPSEYETFKGCVGDGVVGIRKLNETNAIIDFIGLDNAHCYHHQYKKYAAIATDSNFTICTRNHTPNVDDCNSGKCLNERVVSRLFNNTWNEWTGAEFSENYAGGDRKLNIEIGCGFNATFFCFFRCAPFNPNVIFDYGGPVMFQDLNECCFIPTYIYTSAIPERPIKNFGSFAICTKVGEQRSIHNQRLIKAITTGYYRGIVPITEDEPYAAIGAGCFREKLCPDPAFLKKGANEAFGYVV